MNQMIGQKIAITSNKPQTTRNRIQTVYHDERGQIVFLDTPGIHKAKNKLGEYMVGVAEKTFSEVDLVLWLVEATTFIGRGERYIAEELKQSKAPVILVMNKIDTIKKDELLECIAAYKDMMEFAEIIPVSAWTGENVDELITTMFSYLEEGPAFYDEDTITDQPVRQNYISLIKMNNDLLLSIVNDVLDISRIESDMMTFTYMDVYLPSFMKDLYNSIQLRRPEGVEMTLDACPDIIFNIDRNRLWQICMNLLTNAVKHTKKGRIWFGYTIEAEEKMIKFYVSDTGCGIPKDELDNIFARFVQLSDFEQGVGLGLAICKGLVLKMGGNISVISEEGFGSTFIFTLPMKRPNSWKN